jgi:hypothetical protein
VGEIRMMVGSRYHIQLFPVVKGHISFSTRKSMMGKTFLKLSIAIFIWTPWRPARFFMAIMPE